MTSVKKTNPKIQKKKNESDTSQETTLPKNHRNAFPILPLRDIVVFPYMIVPLFVGRKRSINAINLLMPLNEYPHRLLLLTQKNSEVEDPEIEDLYTVGALVNVLQVLKLPDGTVKILVEGEERFKVEHIEVTQANGESFFNGYGEIIKEKEIKKDFLELEALKKGITEHFEEYIKQNKKIPADILSILNQITDYSKFADTVASYFSLRLEDKQMLLETSDIQKRLEMIYGFIDTELDIHDIQQKIKNRIKGQMEKSQRDYYLNEQLKAIYQELHNTDQGFNEVFEFEETLKKKKLPKEAHQKAETEIRKLRSMNATSAEAVVVRNYLDWLLNLPWNKNNKLKHDINNAEKVLDTHHYALTKVKERIIEFLAVQERVKKVSGSILCLVGPPGVGKTSLGKSIAEATGRDFYKISLGGLNDESEIRGHRRTYIGSMPGKIVQALRKVESNNPLILLDEIDKIGKDWRGDPSSALLEVLDPEQNKQFNDHYLEVNYDLSNVLFITTANTLDMPPPLLDRLEIIRVPGYTEEEKQKICQQYLIPKQMTEHGLSDKEIAFEEAAIIKMIRAYTKESGVRNLDREVARVCRKSVVDIAKKRKKNIHVDEKQIQEYCGIPKYSFGAVLEKDEIGVCNGLAWTEMGGDLLKIEAICFPGSGKKTLTGHLGEVMLESIETAFSLVRKNGEQYGLTEAFFSKHDIHVHVPEGATPKDGPSAGIGMYITILSAVTNTPIKKSIAMTGEIDLVDNVMEIGGLREKLLAALRGGISKVLVPYDNKKDLDEMPENIKKGLEIILLKKADEALPYVFETGVKKVTLKTDGKNKRKK